MKRLSHLFLFVLAISLFSTCKTFESSRTAYSKTDSKIALQTFTFRHSTLFEVFDKANELGIKYLEVFPRQKVGDDIGDVFFDYKLNKEQKKKILDYARSKGIKIVSTGVLTPKTEEWVKIFQFAADMDIEFISAEPSLMDFNTVENLAKKYNIKVAIHNHPNEKSFWKPEVLLTQIEKRSNLLGGCVDIGHYKRMDVDPIESLKKIKNRIIALHFKDIKWDEPNNKYKDVVIGKGILNIPEVLKVLKENNFNGYYTIEYEADTDDKISDIKASIQYFNNIK